MFLQSLPDVLNRGILNQNVAIHKILPLLVMGLHASAGNEAAMTQDVNRREVLAIVPLLFQIAESYLAKSPELFQRHITPLVPLLFAINDRGVRGVVLQKISLLEGHLDKTAINSSVFEPMCSGFTDSSAPLRELTLKSTIVLVPKLNHANTEKLVRYLIRLQSDPEASIRTNTVIFIGKIAPNLTEMSRQKLILPAFMRSMKDPFMPCRLSALRAIVTCKEYFTQKDLADKVLPAVAPHTLDAANDVRKEAFNVGLEMAPDHPEILARVPFRGVNLWPAGQPALQAHDLHGVQELAEMFGGRMTVDVDPDGGVGVSVTLPADSAHPPVDAGGALP